MEFSLRQEPKESTPKKRLNGWQRIKEALFIVGLMVALFTYVALLTYNSADPSWSQTAWDGPVKNSAGALGAWLADTLFFMFGALAYLLPAALVLGAWVFLRHRDASEPLNYTILGTRILGLVVLFLTSCSLADLNFDDFWYFSSGGVVGDVVTSMVLPLFNVLGTTLVMMFLWAAGFTLFTGISWLTIVDALGESVLNGVDWVLAKVRGEQSEVHSAFESRGEDKSLEMTDLDVLAKPLRAKTEDMSVGEPQSVETTSAAIKTATNHDLACDGSFGMPDILMSPAEQGLEGASQPEQEQEEKRVEPIIHFPEEETSADALTPWQEADHENHESDLNPDQEEPDVQVVEAFTFHNDLDSEPEELNSQQDDVLDFTEDDTQWRQEQRAHIEDEGQTAPVEQAEPVHTDFEQPSQFTSFKPVEPVGDSDSDSEDEDPFMETIREAKAKEAAKIHPFLRRQEENLPKPKEPLPTVDLLDPPRKSVQRASREELEHTARLVEARLSDYKIDAKVVGVYPGPVITRYELELAPGVKVSRISGLSKDIARSLSASAVRVVEVIPGKPYIGLELPNAHREMVSMSEVVDSERFKQSKSPLSVVLGKNIAGESVVTDLAKTPHLLVAGTTGSGKSVGVNVMIVSMLYKASPDEVRFIMIDPKMLELSVYEGIPHLLTEVVTDMKDAGNALRWCVGEMERRYKLMSMLGVRNIAGFNDKVKEAEEANHPIPDPLWKPGDSMDPEAPMLEKLPYIVVVVDEFADLMMVVGKKVEELIARLAQKARAAGIHLVLATQRPSVDVITGLIKANIPSRVAFTVSTKTDSRTILDQGGAESLLGMGDMLFMMNGSNHPERVHGAFVSDDEVHRVVSNWKARGKPNYIDGILNDDQGADSLLPGEAGGSDDDLDPLFDQVVEFVTDSRRGSVSGVQRRFKIGYNRAARIVEQLEAHGIVSSPGHNGNREVLAPPPPRD
ncbi:DNA translocase FtsK 4TM domain-containing protein [Parasalinivibrio latis]|uniref:DNA translocase FtsK n=1 Tax=Parasalinivibrio latis TaxID=2952610 RepID=UPI0030E19F51